MDHSTYVVNQNHTRRRSSIFPQYLRRKSARKDSTFASESTTNLWPYQVEDKQPTLYDYRGSSAKDEDLSTKFGWINGVYIRTVLNIWGVMLFLRMGWITGHAGILVSLAIVLISTLVTVCTTLSMSAICTNGEVGTGGIYYMISRSLGAEAGSMIGVIFSFANAVLVSINLVGAAETTVEILGLYDLGLISATNDTRIYAAILLCFVAIIPLVGMEWEAKALFGLLVILLVAILNYIIGTFIPPSEEKVAKGLIGWKSMVIEANLYPRFDDDVGLAEIFSVFFPSVIGIFAGASMSGDLRDPNAAIPKGTFLAIFTTSSVYALLIIFLGFTVLPFASNVYEEMANVTNPENISCLPSSCLYGLNNDYQTMSMSSGFGPLIYAGIYAACISSALGSYVCAPRIFQALCEDKLFPYIHYFAKGYGTINDPRRGYIPTFIIALVFIAIGDLNTIAPIISNFFMASFCLVNVACFHASFVGSPSFRPSFRFYNQWVSLVTGLCCVGIMFFLSWIWAIVTVVIMGVIWLYISKKNPDVNWGTSTRGHLYNNALSSALKLNYVKDHVKNFRPSILLLTGNPSARIPLVEFANNITKNQSLLLIGHITDHEIAHDIREKVINSQYEWMLKRKIKAFYVLLESASLASGAKTMLQVTGLGRKLSPSIVMLGYKSSWRDCIIDDLLDYYNVLLKAVEMSIGICVLRIQEGLDYADFFGPKPTSDMKELNTLATMPEEFGFTPEENYDTVDSNGSTKVRFAQPAIIQMERNNTHHNAQSQYSQNRKINKMKTLIPNDAMDAINQFNVKQKEGPIDIWWLAEDGGLTILIPYLLSINYLWSDCYVRVYCFAKNTEEIEKIQSNMTELLDRLRIPFAEVHVFAESELEVSDRSKGQFRSFVEGFMSKNDLPSKTKLTKNDLSMFEEKTSQYLKIRDLLTLHSKQSTLIVMTLPLPYREIMAPLYMAWLETITEDMPPFLFVRGHKSVIAI